MMKKRVIIALVLLVLAIGLILYHNSYRIALFQAGLSETHLQYIDWGVNDSDREYRAVYQFESDDTVKFALLTRGPLGIWTVTIKNRCPTEYPFFSAAWFGGSTMRTYGEPGKIKIDVETHYVLGGNNAIRDIELPYGQLPANSTVSITQSGSLYLIHVISYDEMGSDESRSLDLVEILMQNHSIFWDGN